MAGTEKEEAKKGENRREELGFDVQCRKIAQLVAKRQALKAAIQNLRGLDSIERRKLRLSKDAPSEETVASISLLRSKQEPLYLQIKDLTSEIETTKVRARAHKHRPAKWKRMLARAACGEELEQSDRDLRSPAPCALLLQELGSKGRR